MNCDTRCLLPGPSDAFYASVEQLLGVTQKRHVRLHVVALVIQSASNPSANEMAFAASFIFRVVRCEIRSPMLPFGTV